VKHASTPSLPAPTDKVTAQATADYLNGVKQVQALAGVYVAIKRGIPAQVGLDIACDSATGLIQKLGFPDDAHPTYAGAARYLAAILRGLADELDRPA